MWNLRIDYLKSFDFYFFFAVATKQILIGKIMAFLLLVVSSCKRKYFGGWVVLNLFTGQYTDIEMKMMWKYVGQSENMEQLSDQLSHPIYYSYVP